MLTSLVFNIKIKIKKYFKINFEIFFKLKGTRGHPQDKCTTRKLFYKKCKKFYNLILQQ